MTLAEALNFHDFARNRRNRPDRLLSAPILAEAPGPWRDDGETSAPISDDSDELDSVFVRHRTDASDHAATICSACFRLTLTNWLMPRSGMVTP